MRAAHAGRAMNGPPLFSRWASQLVKFYLRCGPVDRGKWWLRQRVSKWLVARLETGPWIRVSGVADFEWKTLLGADNAESATSMCFRNLLQPGQTVVDVGANVGYYSLTAASRVGSSGRVIAFEPGPPAAARLLENVALNGFPNIEIVQSAVADRTGSVAFSLGNDSEGSSMFDISGNSVQRYVDVPVTTLDGYLSTTATKHVDLLKIDAEGAELGVVMGARNLLADPDSPALIIEANPVTLSAAGTSVGELRDELNSLGYAISVLESISWMGTTVENWLGTKSIDQRIGTE
jgi:FkbM family methyltransferase